MDKDKEDEVKGKDDEDDDDDKEGGGGIDDVWWGWGSSGLALA